MPCAAKMTLGEWSGEDTAAIDVATLYLWGCKPFLGALGQYSGTIRAEIGRSQKGLFKMSLVLVVYCKYYILQEECALSRCIEVLYYKGLDVEARSGEPPSVLTLFNRVFVNLTSKNKSHAILARSLHQSVPIVHAIVLQGSTTLGPVSILSSSGGSNQC